MYFNYLLLKKLDYFLNNFDLRGASCPGPNQPCGWTYLTSHLKNPHVLYGALVSGPNKTDHFEDFRDKTQVSFVKSIRDAVQKKNRIFHDIVQNSFDTYPPYLIMT